MHRIVLNKEGDSEARVLVEGNHRLEAARQRGWVTIPAYVIDLPEIDTKLWEIAENLICSELDVEQKAVQRAEFARLSAVKRGELEPDAPVSQLATPPTAGQQSQAGGIRETARALGVSNDTLRRDIAIASIPQEVRDEARAAGVTTQSDLLKVATAEPQKQVEVIAGISKKKVVTKADRAAKRVANEAKAKAAKKSKAPDVELTPEQYLDARLDEITDHCSLTALSRSATYGTRPAQSPTSGR